MDAGRELDALVAEKVMGWTDVKMDTWHQKGSWYGHNPENKRPNGTAPLPRYSTNIAAAWEVVEKMNAEDEFLFLTLIQSNFAPREGLPSDVQWAVGFGETPCVYGITAPIAICLAALAVVEATLPQKVIPK